MPNIDEPNHAHLCVLESERVKQFTADDLCVYVLGVGQSPAA